MSMISRAHPLPFALGVLLGGFLSALILVGINEFNAKGFQSVALVGYQAQQASVAVKVNSLSELPVERAALLSSPEKVASFEEVQDVVSAINKSEREEIMRFVDRFDTLGANNVYLPALYKAAIEKLALLGFTDTLDEVLFRLSDDKDATGTHRDYWNRLALHTLAEQQYDLVHQSFGLVAAMFNLAPLQSHPTSSLSAELEPKATEELNELVFGESPSDKLNSDVSELGIAEHYKIALEYVALGELNHPDFAEAIGEWALADLQGAVYFVQNEVVDVADRETLIIDVLFDWSEREPESALEGLTELISSDLNLGEAASVELGQLYASEKYKHSPLEAFEWIRSHPNEELSSTTLDNVLLPWIQDSPDDAYSYLSQLDFNSGIGTSADSSQLDLAEEIMLAFILNDNEQTALDWLGLQTNPEIIRRGNDLLATVVTEQ